MICNATIRCRVVESLPGQPKLQIDPLASSIPLIVRSSAAERDWEDVAVRSCEQPVLAAQAPLCRFTVLPKPDGSGFNVVLVMHHAIIDGVSFLSLLRELLLRLAGQPLPPQFADLEFQPPQKLVTTRWERWRTIARLIRRRWKQRGIRVGLLPAEVSSPGSVVRQVWRRESTAALVAKCRAEQTTVLGAVTAACLQTLAGDQRWEEMAQEVHLPVNLRGYYASPVAAEVLGCYVTRLNFRWAAPPSASMWELARQFRREIQAELQSRGPCCFDHLLSKIRITRSVLLRPPPATICINNLGQWLSTDDLPWRLSELSWFGFARHAGAGLGLSLLTVDGCLNLTWSGDRISRETLQRLGQNLLDRLEHALDDYSAGRAPAHT